MNARELIEALSRLDPETPIRYTYWSENREDFTEEDVESVSIHGWLNDDEDDEEFDEKEIPYIGEPVVQLGEFPVFERILREKLSKVYPRFESVGFDGSLYWKSLEEYGTGDIIKYKGKEYRVKYGWHWRSQGPVPLYMAELEPADFDRATHIPGSDSRMKEAS